MIVCGEREKSKSDRYIPSVCVMGCGLCVCVGGGEEVGGGSSDINALHGGQLLY